MSNTYFDVSESVSMGMRMSKSMSLSLFDNLSPASKQKLILILRMDTERERADGEYSLTSFTAVGNAINCMFNRVFQIFQITYTR